MLSLINVFIYRSFFVRRGRDIFVFFLGGEDFDLFVFGGRDNLVDKNIGEVDFYRVEFVDFDNVFCFDDGEFGSLGNKRIKSLGSVFMIISLLLIFLLREEIYLKI